MPLGPTGTPLGSGVPTVAKPPLVIVEDIEWENSTLLDIARETHLTTAALPDGPVRLFIKGVDTSGNKSLLAAEFDLNVASAYQGAAKHIAGPRWVGTLNNMVKHAVSGGLVPESQVLAGAVGWEVFDEFVHQPKADPYYETKELDVGFDAAVRVSVSSQFRVNPDDTGEAKGRIDLDFRRDNEIYDGFERWTIGQVTGRFFRARIVPDMTAGTPWIKNGSIAFETQPRTEVGKGTAVVGGQAQLFQKPFFAPPTVLVTPAFNAGVRIGTYESVTSTSFVARIFDAAGTEVGGDFSYSARGL